MKKTAIILTLLLTASTMVFAGQGGLPLEILSKGIGVRNIAMGEAGAANCADSSAMFWNPAILDLVNKNQVYASFDLYYGAANYDYISYVSPIGKFGAFGVSFGLMNYGDYDVVDVDGNVTGSETARDMVIGASYGRTMIAGIRGGFNLKTIMKTMGSTSASGFNADVAFYRPFGEIFEAGLIVKNALPTAVKYGNGEDKFTTSLRGGVSVKLLDETLRLSADVEKYFIASDAVIGAGLEYKIAGIAAVRAGYNTSTPLGISGGLGVALAGFSVDYAVVNTGLGLSHKAALSYAFGGYDLSLKSDQESFSPVTYNNKAYIRITANTKYDTFKWRVEIKNQDAKVMKAWEGAGVPTDTVIWDGLREEDGMPASEGDYTAVITVTDENDDVQRSVPIKIRITTSGTKDMLLQ